MYIFWSGSMKNIMMFSFFALFCLTACQSNQSSLHKFTAIDQAFFIDDQFVSQTPITIESAEDIFALDEEMRTMVKEVLLPERTAMDKTRRLLEHIFNEENIALTYNKNANVTAREVYHQQSANCMSLTIMAYALAKEAGLNIRFQEVEIPEYWVRHGRYNMLTGHVNLVVTPQRPPNKYIVWGTDAVEIDFDPYASKRYFNRKIIDKNRVLAMYYNNKGAEALVAVNYVLAYNYFKTAILFDSSFSTSWGNLGVLYRLTEHEPLAKKVYQYALAVDSENLTVLGNMAILLKLEGDIEGAEKLEKILKQKRHKNPYYQALLADEALYNGKFDQAILYYKRAIKMDGKVHEFYFGLAKVYFQLNKIYEAQKAMQKAIAINRTKTIESQYIAKLNFLKTVELTH